MKRIDLAPLPVSVGSARRFVRQVLAEWGLEDSAETAMLLTSELATNALLHARSGFAVIVSRLAEDLRVDVLDRSTTPPRLRQAGMEATTGRGVALVSALARTWGVTPVQRLDDYRKGVWFTLPCSKEARR